MMTRRSFLARTAGVLAAGVAGRYVPALAAPAIVPSATDPLVIVYKSPSCGCCAKWVDHLRAAGGLRVETRDRDPVEPIKTRLGVPNRLWSCHTAQVEGYVIEGHVPAADVKRLLAKRPAVAGIAVPGMPVGSPGMETPGVAAQRYQVLAYTKDGGTTVFAER